MCNAVKKLLTVHATLEISILIYAVINKEWLFAPIKDHEGLFNIHSTAYSI